MRTAVCTLVVALLSTLCSAQSPCLEWSGGFALPGSGFGPNPPDGAPQSDVMTIAAIDTGNGVELYAGGSFTTSNSTNDKLCVARWSGAEWDGVGDYFFNGSGGGHAFVRALVRFDDGNGPAVYAGGLFTTVDGQSARVVVRWNGTAWGPVGSGISGQLTDLEVFDDGTGPALYASGFFNPPFPSRLLRWDGTSWSTVVAGASGSVGALEVFDDGTGPALYMAGSPTNVSLQLMRWDGTNLTSIPGGPSGIQTLLAHDDGSGPALYAGGPAASIGGLLAGVLRWDGSTWSNVGALGGPASGIVHALSEHDDGSGPALYAAGSFTSAGGVAASNVARWDGTQWSALGLGSNGKISSLASWSSPNGPRLLAGGVFGAMDGKVAPCFSAWDGTQWGGLAPSQGIVGKLGALEVFDDGSGERLWAGGSFSAAGGAFATNLARYDGQQWTAAGDPDGPVTCFGVWDDGNGPELYVGGTFLHIGGIEANQIARWDGQQWSALGNGLTTAGPTQVHAIEPFDDGTGSALYVGGFFTTAGDVQAFHVARWNGQQWSAVGGGANGQVLSLRAYDDGSGPALYAGGTFSAIGTVTAHRIARFDGTHWSNFGEILPAGTAVIPYELEVFDAGNGPRLYAGGIFGDGVAPTFNLAAWDGTIWDPIDHAPAVGLGTGHVLALEAFDDGSGPALYLGGSTLQIGHPTRPAVVKWDGTTFSAVGPGEGEGVAALASMATLGGARDLYVGGSFHGAGDTASWGIARWEGCGASGELYCFGDGSQATACPCGNSGAPKHGCENSSSTGGALLAASGETSQDSIVLTSSGELPTALSIVLQGSVELDPGVPFGDGVRCVGGVLKRLYVVNAVGGSISVPGLGDPSISTRSAQLGDVIAPGTSRSYQVYYRDPSLAFCAAPAGDGWNVSNAVRLAW